MLKTSQSGTSLLSVMVAVGIAGILATVVAKISTNGIFGAKSAELRQDIVSMQQTISSRLDCNKTLNVTGIPSTPLSCGSYASLTVKDRKGTAISNLGDWTIHAGCSGDQIIVSATRPGKDPLTGKLKNDLATNMVGATVSTDLFGGTSSFCSAYFNGTSSTCPAGYFSLGVDANGKPACNATVLRIPMTLTGNCQGLATYEFGPTWRCRAFAGGQNCPAGFVVFAGTINCAMPWVVGPCPGFTIGTNPVSQVLGGNYWSAGCYEVYESTACPGGINNSYSDAISITCVKSTP